MGRTAAGGFVGYMSSIDTDTTRPTTLLLPLCSLGFVVCIRVADWGVQVGRRRRWRFI